MAFPKVVVICRAAPIDLLYEVLRVGKHLPPTHASALEDILASGGEVPSEGTPLFLTSAQGRGAESRARELAMVFLGCRGLGRTDHSL